MAHSKTFLSALAGASLTLTILSTGQAQEPPIVGGPTAGGSIAVQYAETPLRLILNDYEIYSGKRLIKDQLILDQPMTIETVQEMNREQWLDYMERALLLNGIVLVPVDDNTLKALGYANKTPASEGLQTYVSEADLPPGEEVVNYIMPLDFVTTEEAMRIFLGVTQSEASPLSAITEVPDANMLIITERANIIRSLIGIKEKIDVRPGQIETITIELKLADVEVVAQAVNEILTQQQEQRAGAAATRRTGTPTQGNAPQQARPPGVPADAGGGAAPSAQTVPGTTGQPTGQGIVVYPDIRTNRLFLVGRPIDLVYVEELVKKFDAPNEVENFINRSLSHVSVDTILDVLTNALTARDPLAAQSGGAAGGAGGGAGGGGAFGGAGLGQNQGRQNQGGQTNQFGGGGFGAGGGAGGGGGGGAGAATGQIFGDQDLGPLSRSVGKTFFMANSKSNTISAFGTPQDLQLINNIIDELDVRPRQVYLSTVVGQVSLGDDIDWGIDLLHRVKDFEVGGRTIRAGGLFQTGTGSNVIDLDTLAQVADFPSSLGLNVYGQIGDYINAYLRALESTNRFQVLSRPSIYVTNNRIASISSGQAVAIPSSTQSSFGSGVGNTGLISNIQYRDVTLQLNVQPLINSDDEITLKIMQINDNIIGNQDILGTVVPIIGRQELETEVTIPNKSTIVLGGLITESNTDNRTGLPILVHIPLLKHLFSDNSISKERNELLIFIQPHIVTSAQDLVDANLDQTQSSSVTRPAMEFNRPEADKSQWSSQDGAGTSSGRFQSPRKRAAGSRR